MCIRDRIIRIPSVPFFAFKDRRFAYRGFSKALEIAKQYQLDIIHTQTEFSLGLLGIWIARELKIPVIHTYHTQYEDYVHYIAKGMLIRPSMVKYLVRGFLHDVDGVICPSEIVRDLLSDYKVKMCIRDSSQIWQSFNCHERRTNYPRFEPRRKSKNENL